MIVPLDDKVLPLNGKDFHYTCTYVFLFLVERLALLQRSDLLKSAIHRAVQFMLSQPVLIIYYSTCNVNRKGQLRGNVGKISTSAAAGRFRCFFFLIYSRECHARSIVSDCRLFPPC